MEEYWIKTDNFLCGNSIRYDYIIFNVPYGERILVNDEKLSGLKTAYVVNAARDKWDGLQILKEKGW